MMDGGIQSFRGYVVGYTDVAQQDIPVEHYAIRFRGYVVGYTDVAPLSLMAYKAGLGGGISQVNNLRKGGCILRIMPVT